MFFLGGGIINLESISKDFLYIKEKIKQMCPVTDGDDECSPHSLVCSLSHSVHSSLSWL